MSLHQDLLRQARMLATRERTQPREASLRRAVSAAYYALFHLLVHEASNALLPGMDRASLRQCMGRAFMHADMKEVSQGFASGNLSPKVRPALVTMRPPPELVRVAEAFVDLQQARHEADYDTARQFTRQDALDLVDLAEHAFKDWRIASKSPAADVYLVALLCQRQMRL